MDIIIYPKENLKGVFTVPGDKSISHRAVMFGSISDGRTNISGFLTGEDCLSTISCFKKMGIEIEVCGTDVVVHGKGLHGLSSPEGILDVGNSGTTIRLLTGLLCGQDFNCKLTGDNSIQKRPMERVAVPLREMGADISGRIKDNKLFAPVNVKGKKLKGISYAMNVASAQVKSAILLASLYADGQTEIIEPEPTRNHTEIMLNYLGADIKRDGNKIISSPVKELYAKEIHVPGDISSAAYFLVTGTICKNSEITINNVGVNPTRTGIISVLHEMGANISVENKRVVCGEPVADIHVKYSKLKGITIGGDIIPSLIDEIPVIAVAASLAEGKTVIKDAGELKVKESNRIKTIVCELKKLGADIEETEDGMVINGVNRLKGNVCESYGDHRIAMSIAVAALASQGETTIKGMECADISFPGFYDYIERL